MTINGERSRELAKIALFEFILGDTEQKQIDAFNRILTQVGINTQLSRDNGKFVWEHCSYDDQYRAETLFNQIANQFSFQRVKELMDQEQFLLLLSEYGSAISDTVKKLTA